MRVGKVPESNFADRDRKLWWTVKWDCPDHPTRGFQRTFDNEWKAEEFLGRLASEGCPKSPWFPDEHANG